MYRNTSIPINARKRSSTGSFFTALRREAARRLALRCLTLRPRFAGRLLRFRDTYSTSNGPHSAGSAFMTLSDRTLLPSPRRLVTTVIYFL